MSNEFNFDDDLLNDQTPEAPKFSRLNCIYDVKKRSRYGLKYIKEIAKNVLGNTFDLNFAYLEKLTTGCVDCLTNIKAPPTKYFTKLQKIQIKYKILLLEFSGINLQLLNLKPFPFEYAAAILFTIDDKDLIFDEAMASRSIDKALRNQTKYNATYNDDQSITLYKKDLYPIYHGLYKSLKTLIYLKGLDNRITNEHIAAMCPKIKIVKIE